MATDIGRFIDFNIYPAMFRRLPELFPDMGFKWTGHSWDSPFKLSGDKARIARSDKCRVTENCPRRIYEQGEGSKDLIEFFMERNRMAVPSGREERQRARVEAARAIAGRLGILFPEYDRGSGERWAARQARQDSREALASEAAAALRNSEEGRKVFDYLTKERGYPEEFVDGAGLGYVDSALAAKMRKEADGGVSLNANIGARALLAIPVRTMGGQVTGFDFREIEGERRYYNFFFSASESKKSHLFGLQLAGRGDRKDIVLVEGELDALFSSYKGVRNVCAAGGKEGAAVEALKEAKDYGFERVTVLFDTESGADSQASTDRSVKKTIANIREAGLVPFVCSLPSENGGKADPDSFLKTHTGEELQALVDAAEMGGKWQVRDLKRKHAGKDGVFSDKGMDDFEGEVASLCASKWMTPKERDLTEFEAAAATGGRVRAETLKAAAEAKRRREQTAALLSEAQRLASEGKTDAAASLMRKGLAEIGAADRGTRETTGKRTRAEIRQKQKEGREGIETDYLFLIKGNSVERERLVLPPRALTYIGAQTSHGKSRLLQNIALQTARKESGAAVYYSFEEEESDVEREFINLAVGLPLAPNNLRSLKKHYKTDGRDYSEEFTERESGYFDLREAGKLRIIYKPEWDCGDLADNIRYLCGEGEVSAVFIDHIHEMKIRDAERASRKEQLKEICETLRALAAELDLPIVLAAQLNREAGSPLDLRVQNLADASEIEQEANVVVLLWNAAVEPLADSSFFTKKGKGRGLSQRAEELKRRGFDIEAGQGIYAVLAKNRGSVRGADAVLNFDGNTGRITPETGLTEIPQQYQTAKKPEKAKAYKPAEAVSFGRPKGEYDIAAEIDSGFE